MAQQQPQRQQHPVQPMEQLQGLLNIILLQVGHVMSDPNKRRDPSTRIQLQVIPSATHRFHEALDKLEDELTRARAVMRRDLAVLQRAREQREKAEAEEREKAARKEMNGMPDGGAIKDTGKEDIVMVDGGVAAQQPQAVEKPKSEQGPISTDREAKSKEQPPDQAKEVTSEAVSTATASQAPEATAPNPSESLPLSATVPELMPNDTTSAGAQTDSIAGIDLDAMFAEMTADTAQQQNANGDAGAAGISDHDLDLTYINDAAGDVASLLPGLENYATLPEGGDLNAPQTNHGGAGSSAAVDAELDFSMLDIPTSEQQQKKPEEVQQGNADGLNLDLDLSNLGDAGGDLGQESNLDELFFNLDDLDYDAGAAGGGDSTAGEELFDFFNS